MEGLILTPYWICFYDFNSYFAMLVFISIHKGLLQETLPISLLLTLGLGCLCLTHRGDSLTLNTCEELEFFAWETVPCICY